MAMSVEALGTLDFERVSSSELTRTIERRREFGGCGCPVYGSHPGRARAAFYSEVATRLTGKAQ